MYCNTETFVLQWGNLFKSTCENWRSILGFRDFAKDYKIEFVDRPGHKRPKAVRVYVGAWYRFKEPPEKIKYLKWYYLVALLAVALTSVVPMCIDCNFTRIWYIQLPAVMVSIPWVFAACAVWRLWTAKEKVDREHKTLLGDRMNGASLFLTVFSVASFLGCVVASFISAPQIADILVSGCCLLSGAGSIAMFAKRKQLEMVLA